LEASDLVSLDVAEMLGAGHAADLGDVGPRDAPEEEQDRETDAGGDPGLDADHQRHEDGDGDGEEVGVAVALGAA